ncbi:MAG: adenylyltransferase/cytidyltransferase family protein [Verrucomicrobiota bacterium]|jgi:cytidyltransferase-like protein
MRHIFVSGCYDIIHAGHVQFFREAKALGDFLTVSFASSDVLWAHKQRRSSLPDEHKKGILEAMSMIDQVVVGKGTDHGLDFLEDFRRLKPDVLAVTEDDQYGELKRSLCKEIGAEYVVLPKTPPLYKPVSTTQLVKWIRAPKDAPLRVDFAGGWLDVPRHAQAGDFIVNCAIQPKVSLRDWGYERNAGLGGSGAWSLLNGNTGVDDELDLGVGWQDPAVIRETGLCIWRSGRQPSLEFKTDGRMLQGLMALWWTGKPHDTPAMADLHRDYSAIGAASRIAREGVLSRDVTKLGAGVSASYDAQLVEGMAPLPDAKGCLGRKYCGGGFGGYALYLFGKEKDRAAFVTATVGARTIEPYSNWA